MFTLSEIYTIQSMSYDQLKIAKNFNMDQEVISELENIIKRCEEILEKNFGYIGAMDILIKSHNAIK